MFRWRRMPPPAGEIEPASAGWLPTVATDHTAVPGLVPTASVAAASLDSPSRQAVAEELGGIGNYVPSAAALLYCDIAGIDCLSSSMPPHAPALCDYL